MLAVEAHSLSIYRDTLVDDALARIEAEELERFLRRNDEVFWGSPRTVTALPADLHVRVAACYYHCLPPRHARIELRTARRNTS